MPENSRPHIFVATHHKSGTVWLISTFRRIAQANSFIFNHLNTGESGWNLRSDKLEYFEQQRAISESQSDLPAIFVDYHSAFPDLSNCKGTRGARGIHIIRDPRDMLLSAVRYHLVSDEPWLHQPMKEFANQTYQQKLNTYSTLEDRIKFEIDHYMGRAIREMHAFDRQNVFRDVKYEELIIDHDMLLWHELLIHLEMKGTEIIRSMQAFWHSSIFGEMKEVAESGNHKHIHDSKPKQWQSQLSAESLDLIQCAYETEIAQLGYQLADPADLVYTA